MMTDRPVRAHTRVLVLGECMVELRQTSPTLAQVGTGGEVASREPHSPSASPPHRRSSVGRARSYPGRAFPCPPPEQRNDHRDPRPPPPDHGKRYPTERKGRQGRQRPVAAIGGARRVSPQEPKT